MSDRTPGVLSRWFSPDRVFGSFHQVDPDFLRSSGVRFLLLDIDNTIAPHGARVAPEATVLWLRMLQGNGISCHVISNAGQERIAEFCQSLGIPFIARAHKPSVHPVLTAMAHLGATAGTTAFLGDQLFTDVLCARKAGVSAFLVRPVSPVEPWTIRLKRFFERLILGRVLSGSDRALWF